MKQNDIDIEEGGGSSASPMQDELAATTTESNSNSNRDDNDNQPPSNIDMTRKKQDDNNNDDEQPLISKIDSLISRFNRPTAATIRPPITTYKSTSNTIAKVDDTSSNVVLSESSNNDTSSPSTTSADGATDTDTDTNHDKSIISTSTTPTTQTVDLPVITADQTNELTPPPVVENHDIVNDKDSTTIANNIDDDKDSTIETSSQVVKEEMSDQNTPLPVVADVTSNRDEQGDISTPIAVVESSHTADVVEETEKDIETGVQQDINNDNLEEGDTNTNEGDTNQNTCPDDIESQTEENSSNINEVVENSEVKESAVEEKAKALETHMADDDDDEATPVKAGPLILPWWKQRRTKILVAVIFILMVALALALGISLSTSSSSQDQPSSATTTALVTTSSPSVSIIPTAHPSSLSSQDDLFSSLPTQSSIDTSLAPSTSTPSTSAPITSSPSLSPTTLQPTDKPVTNSPSKKPTLKPVITTKPTSLSPTSNPVASSTVAGPLDFDDQEEEEQSSCKDTPNYLDMYGGTCEDYMLDGNEAWCGGYGNDGGVGETPNENCCVCKQQQVIDTDTKEEEVEEVQSEETTDATAMATDNEDLAPPFGDSDQDIISKWLEAHNSRRKKWHENGGKEYNALKWSDSLSQASQIWADHLLESGCGDFTLAHDMENVYGENLAAAFDDGTGLSPDGVLERWVEGEEDLIWPGNIHLTQVLWRATTHVGCAKASKLDGFLTCHSYVCRYARPGNCNMIVEPDNNDWWLPIVLKDDSPCTPECPSDGC